MLLTPHFTNLDRPVFALVNLPETVKGALFARYSRYSGTVRRLFLEEFAADVSSGGAVASSVWIRWIWVPSRCNQVTKGAIGSGALVG